MEMFKKCFNPKVLAGLTLAALALFIYAPKLALAALPLLLLAACPLSMLLMMSSMKNTSAGRESEGVTLLKRRLASGEIDDREFERLKNKLS